MKEDLKNIDKLAQQAAENFSVDAPVDAWSRLENELDGQKAIIQMVFVRRAIAVAAVLLAFFAGYQIALLNLNNPQPIPLNGSTISSLPLLEQNSTDNDFIASSQTQTDHSNNYIAQSTFQTSTTNNRTNSTPIEKLSAKPMSLTVEPNYNIGGHSSLVGYILPPFPVFDTLGNDGGNKTPSTPDQFNRSWKIAGSVGPVLASNTNSNFKNFNTYDNTAVMSQSLAERSPSTNSVSFSSGMNVDYNIIKRFSLGTGLYYSRTGQYLNDDAFISSYDYKGILPVQTKYGLVQLNQNTFSTTNLDMPMESFSTVDRQLEQVFEYIEIPVNLKYTLIDKRFKTDIFSGLSQNILVGNKVIYREGINSKNVGKTGNMRTVYFSSHLGLSLQYRINSNFWLHLDPAMRYPLQSLSRDDATRVYPLSFTVYSGLAYRF